jgi:hypothetical protein
MGKPTCEEQVYKLKHRFVKRTWGTETSKYPKEKKSTEILLVAASEHGVSPVVTFFINYSRINWKVSDTG